MEAIQTKLEALRKATTATERQHIIQELALTLAIRQASKA